MIIIDRISDLSVEELAAQLVDLLDASYDHGSPWTKEQFVLALQQEKNHFLYVVNGRNLVGFLAYSYLLDQADIINLAIHPDFQKEGLATQLLMLMEENLNKAKIKEVFLEVRAKNLAAQKFYQVQGFEKISMRSHYYKNPPDHAFILSKELL